MIGNRKLSLVLGSGILLIASCTYYKNEIFIPPVAEETPTLEAVHVTVPPNSINAPYWTTADFLTINVKNITTEQVASGDGLLNMNGTYNGLSDFNDGDAVNLSLKAAYDNEYLYILASWKDKTYNASQGNWFYNGPADPLKEEDTVGWTSQQNDDNLILSFETSGNSRDVWKWSLALSEPMGYAIDMHDDGNGFVQDSGEPMFVRNSVGASFRSGPAYAFNGSQQELTRDPGGKTFLDPGYYLLNITEFLGNAARGAQLFDENCAFCHGNNGEGGGYFDNSAVAINTPGKFNRYDRDGIDELIKMGVGDTTLIHGKLDLGSIRWQALDSIDKNDLIARLRGFSGVPGYMLQNPAGSMADIQAVSNVGIARIDVSKANNGYKVLMIRKLQTGNTDDIQFNPAQQRVYDFHVFLTDNDNENLVGDENKQLTFK